MTALSGTAATIATNSPPPLSVLPLNGGGGDGAAPPGLAASGSTRVNGAAKVMPSAAVPPANTTIPYGQELQSHRLVVNVTATAGLEARAAPYVSPFAVSHRFRSFQIRLQPPKCDCQLAYVAVK